MKPYTIALLFTCLLMASCTQSPSTSNSKTATKEQANSVNTTDSNSSSTESDLQFIRDKYKVISGATDYKTVPFEAQCDERSSTKLERRYNKKGDLSYLKLIDCGGHGCSTKHHYYWDGQLIFIFHNNDSTPGVSHIIEEHRTYFKNGKMIHCLEKKAHYHPGQPPIEELLKKAENKEVDCTPDKLTANLSEIESLSLDKAKAYFCAK